MRIFSNLLCIDPAFHFDAVLRPVGPRLSSKLVKEAQEHVDALVQLYQRGQSDWTGKSSGGGSGEDTKGSASSG